jgi:hypothetical protein
MRPLAPFAPTALTLALALPLSLGACGRDSSGAGAGSSAPSASTAPAAASSVSPQAFCAFLEVLIVDQMTKADARGELPIAVKKEKAKAMNAGCEKSIAVTVAKDPVGWQRCAACLTSKRSLEALKLCDADCSAVGYGGGAAPSTSAKK